MNQTRREMLEKCIALGTVTLATSVSLTSIARAWDTAEKKRKPTPFCELGPFYKRGAPHIAQLRAPGDRGMPLSVAGMVYSENGEILPNAKLEIWQTDNFGHYDNAGYHFRAAIQTDPKSNYGFESVLPGHYPDRVCQHVHYLVTAPGHKPLTTQLYFASDPVFDGDPDKNFSRDPLITSRELVRPVVLKGDPQQVVAAILFDILESLMLNNIALPACAVLVLLVSLIQPARSLGMKSAATVALPCESPQQLISPTGDQVALRCKDHTVRLVNIRSGATQHTFDPEPRINQYNYSHDGYWFAVGLWDGTVEVVPTSGTAEPKRWKSDSRRIETLEFFPDSSGIVVGALDRPAQIWDLRGTPKQVAILHSDFGGLGACTFSPDGKLLLTADGDTVVRFYDTATWRMLHEYRGLTLETFAVAFATDGKRVMIGGPDDRITVLDSATGSELQRLPKDADVIQQLLPFGKDGQAVILYADGDGKRPPHQAIWNVNTAKSAPLTAERPLTGGGIVNGKLWVCSPNGKVLDIWVYE